mgnify:CR=1 FL=1
METNKNKVEKMSTTKTRSTNNKKKAETTTKVSVSPIQEKMSKLETAYMAAISGKMKFGKVKSIFKQLHKEIKKSVKSKN